MVASRRGGASPVSKAEDCLRPEVSEMRKQLAVIGWGSSVVLAAVLLGGCSEDVLIGTKSENRPPEIWLSSGPVENDTTSYKVHFYWGGWDPDGSVACYELVVTEQSPYGFDPQDTIVVAPDYGRAGSAARLAGQLGLPSISAEKTRITDTRVRIGELLSKQVVGFKRAVIYDDEIATGGSVIELCKTLAASGLEEIYLVCTHGLFIGDALQRIEETPYIKEIVTTDTVPIPPEKRRPNVVVLSVAPIFGEAIRRNYARQSVGDLFAFWEDNQ